MAFQSQIRGLTVKHESMAKHCSWRTGGEAELYFEPADKADLSLYLSTTETTVPVTWIGLGSNLLVRDGGVKGVVVGSLNKLNELNLDRNGLVYAECGVTCAKLARFCQKNNLHGADFLAGIPGTVGGALAMNAGAFGFETWQFVESVEMMNRLGVITDRQSSEFEVSYRTVGLKKDEWFSAGYFRFTKKSAGVKNPQESNIKPLLARRNATQPIGLPSCGSVFKNPEGDFSARLIEASGLKGYCIGGACVSDKHANFIINTGNATATEIEQLIKKIQQLVKLKFDIELTTEVRIIGDRS